MSGKDTFDRKFRRQARGLRRRPAPRGWERVEARLDQRRRRRRFGGGRPWLIAAALLLVAGVAFFATVFGGSSPEGDAFVMNQPESVEELAPAPAPTRRLLPRDYIGIDDRPAGTDPTGITAHGRLVAAPKYRL